MNHQTISSLIWSVADLLRGDYRQSEYGRVILSFTVLRRLDCVLEPTKAKVLAEFDAKTKAGLNPDPFLIRKAGQSFYNASPLDLTKLLGDQDNIRQNIYAYVQAFAPAARDIFERFDFHSVIERLAKSNLLYLVAEKFAGFDLHPDKAPAGGKVKLAPVSRLFKNEAFGYTTITVERPLLAEKGAIVLGAKGKQKGKPQADSALRDTENIPLGEDIGEYFKREVLPHAPDAWIDEDKTKVGYEIPFNRHFYVFEPPRNLSEIDEELKTVTSSIMAMLGELAK